MGQKIIGNDTQLLQAIIRIGSYVFFLNKRIKLPISGNIWLKLDVFGFKC